MRARNAREFRTLEAEAAVPVASREFSRTERLLIRFQAYGPGGADPVVSAKLLGRMGNAMRELPVAKLQEDVRIALRTRDDVGADQFAVLTGGDLF